MVMYPYFVNINPNPLKRFSAHKPHPFKKTKNSKPKKEKKTQITTNQPPHEPCNATVPQPSLARLFVSSRLEMLLNWDIPCPPLQMAQPLTNLDVPIFTPLSTARKPCSLNGNSKISSSAIVSSVAVGKNTFFARLHFLGEIYANNTIIINDRRSQILPPNVVFETSQSSIRRYKVDHHVA